jgi:4'-phosphopantetheinyl transferase
LVISSEVQVVVARLDAGPHEARALALSLSQAERSRAACFRFDRERRRFIVARARLRELLAERLDVPPESIEFVYAREGKPALAERFARSGWRFNLSHCGELALYAFSRAGEVGVDVEAVHAIAEADAIAARVFSRREHEAYRALAPTERPLAFFRCWTRKEAFVKALGDGLAVPLERLDASAPPCGWSIESFLPEAGFIGAVAVQE